MYSREQNRARKSKTISSNLNHNLVLLAKSVITNCVASIFQVWKPNTYQAADMQRAKWETKMPNLNKLDVFCIIAWFRFKVANPPYFNKKCSVKRSTDRVRVCNLPVIVNLYFRVAKPFAAKILKDAAIFRFVWTQAHLGIGVPGVLQGVRGLAYEVARQAKGSEGQIETRSTACNKKRSSEKR